MSQTQSAAQHSHPHDHAQPDHDHSHMQTASAENHSARKHPEFVVMNIGGELGGLIVQTDPQLHGTEVEISPTGADHQRAHKDVLERSANGQPAFTAVFDALLTGSYTLWNDNHAVSRNVTITGGEVTQVDWRTTASSD